MSQQSEPKKTRVRIEIRGRINDRETFEAICAAGEADLNAKKGEFSRLLLEAIRDGRSPVITGTCTEDRPLRLTDIGQRRGIPMVFITGYDKERSTGEIYCTNSKHKIMPILPFTPYGPSVPPEMIRHMLKASPWHGLAEIDRSLKYYDADTYPEFTMPRSLQVELMPEEKIGLFAGMRR